MKHDSRPLGTLALSSLRLNKGLLLLAILALLSLLLLGWAVTRLLEEERDKVHFHFARLMADIREHETFLQDVAREYRSQYDDQTLHSPLPSRELRRHERGQQVYQGKQFPLSLPFTLAFDDRFNLDQMASAFSIAVQLADYYGTYWAGSEYASPQMLLYAPDRQFSAAVPGTGFFRLAKPLDDAQYLTVSEKLYERLLTQRDVLNDRTVRWIGPPYAEGPYSKTLSAVIGIAMPAHLLPAPSQQTLGMLVSRLDLGQVEDLARVLERPIYDRFTLMTSGGEILLGSLEGDETLPDGLSLDKHGIHFKLTSSPTGRYTALYVISYTSFLRLAKWPLLALILALSGTLACSWLASRWYRARIVQPAQTAHQRLVESQAFVRDVIDNAPTGLCLVRHSDRSILLENQRAQQWHGTAELVELIEQIDNPKDLGEFCLNLSGRYLQVAIVPTRYRSEDVLLCVFNDITQHRDDNTALAEAKRAADQGSEAKTLFLATMSHEIRTPLYGVLGNLELLGLTNLDPRQRQYLTTIQQSSASLSSLISDVLDVSKIESGQMALEPSAFDPCELAKGTLNAIAAAAGVKGLQIDAWFDPRVPARVLGDPVRIRQILANLLNNALKFTEAGRIGLRLSVIDPLSDPIALRWQVIDSGPGIALNQQARLFTPFYQVPGNPHEGGAGLGLSICASLSELMGGRMRVVSEPGLGSSFFLELSLPVVSSVLPNPGSAASTTHQGKLELRVLVAEDNPINRAILEEQLLELGARVVSTEHGGQALENWVAGAFDVVISDVNMPLVNGYELARRLRQLGASIPIIGVTANAMREEGERCLAAGMNAWIVKPLSIESLRATLLKVCPERTTAPSPIPDSAQDITDLNHLSPAMHALFIETMQADLGLARVALDERHGPRLIEQLHRMSGGLGAVRIATLASECFALETQITEEALTPAAIAATDALLRNLGRLMYAWQRQPTP
ncbi:response regulator [Pseudomonas frederiksbergensis]|uniref:hybrid sensor histidine kinase/response regulator n=1 Tax=Pseudomonas frederiksbergensis TaxID=104087 RepID=UPI003D042778